MMNMDNPPDQGGINPNNSYWRSRRLRYVRDHVSRLDMLLVQITDRFRALPESDGRLCIGLALRTPEVEYLSHWEKQIDSCFPWAPAIDGKDRRWLIVSVTRFLRDYLDTISLTFPSLRCKWDSIDPSFGGCADLLGLVATLKGACLTPMSRLTGGRSPWILPFRGGPRLFLQRAVSQRISARKLLFANSILQLKRVCEKVPASFINFSIDKYRRNLKKPRRQPPWFIDKVSDEAGMIHSRFDFSSIWNPYETAQDPSLNACYENGRRGGGTWGDLISISEGDSITPPIKGASGSASGFGPPIHVRHFDVRPGGVVTYKMGLFPTQGRLASLCPDVPLRRATAICEPLKVRMVTVHQSFESPLWTPFQRKFSRYLADEYPEILSGREVNPSSFRGLRNSFDRWRELGFDDIVVVSDDASSATDSIDPDLTRAVIGSSFPEELHDAFDKTLRGMISIRPEGQPSHFFKQSTGQLMGDRRSFPILCLIHLSAKRAFLRMNGVPRWAWWIRVNGDDGIIVLPRSWVPAYFDFMSNLWELNSLKTYVHNRYFSFNSAIFTLDGVKTPIIRWSLISGIDKFGDMLTNPLIWNTILDSCPSLGRELWERFIKKPHWRSLLDYEMRGTHRVRRYNNWFTPLCSAGLGLVPPDDLEWGLTPRHSAGVREAMFRVIEGLPLGDLSSRVGRRDRDRRKYFVMKSVVPVAGFGKGIPPAMPAGLKGSLVEASLQTGNTFLFAGRLPNYSCWSDVFGAKENLDLLRTVKDVRVDLHGSILGKEGSDQFRL